jgi:rhamnosyltransferase
MIAGKCSFILPTMNVSKHIGPLLQSIYSQEYNGQIDVLIQDSSNDGLTPQIVKQFPVRYIWVEPDDYNYGKTRNEGAAVADGEFLLFLSTDVQIPDKQWLTRLIRHFSDPLVAGVHGRQVPRKNSPPMEQYFIQTTYPNRSRTISVSDGKLKHGMVTFSNTNTAVRRAVWEKIKIPEMIKSEDQEWAKRALMAGYKIVYDSEAWVYHSHKYSINGVFREYFDSGAAMPVVQKGLFKYSIGHFIVDGLRFVGGEYVYMIKNGYIKWIPYSIVYDAAKFFGVFLGSKQKYMPLKMKRKLSKKRNHWDRYKDVIKEPV